MSGGASLFRLQITRELMSLRAAEEARILKGVLILPGPGCKVSEAQKGRLYSLRTLPDIPLEGCDLPNRSDDRACACCYQGVAKET